MNRETTFAAQLLENGASGYAGVAAGVLLERFPTLAERYAPSAFRDWKGHLRQRILELSAALEAAEPNLFASRIRWERIAFRSRSLDEEDLRCGLVCLRDVLGEELPDNARASVDRYVDPVLDSWSESVDEEVGLDPKDPVDRLALHYMETALQGDSLAAIDRIVGAVGDEMTVTDAYFALMRAQQEAGRLWHLGELNIAEEHVVTATTERATAVLVQGAPRAEPNGKTAVVAAVAGNRHSLPVRAVADFFALVGWRSISLGADLPVSEAVAAVECFKADIMALSVAMPTQIKAARETVTATRRVHPELKVLVGGRVFFEAPDLWQRIGADGYIDRVQDAPSVAFDLLTD